MTSRLHVFCISAASVLLTASLADASDYAFRLTLDRSSAASGLGRTTMPLLARTLGPGARAAADLFVRQFAGATGNLHTRGSFRTAIGPEIRVPRVHYVGDAGWDLRVYGDGTALSYRNTAYLSGAANPSRPATQRLSNDQLEALGRAVITDQLGSLVPLARNETLAALFSEHRIDRAIAVGETTPASEEVTESTVIFTRVIDGSAVIGGGSKIAIHFANDGTPVALDLDWPAYTAQATRVDVLAIDAIHRRASAVLAVDPFARDSQLSRVECGYVDAGARRGDVSAAIQPGCYYFVHLTRVGDPERNRADPSDGLLAGAFAAPVPAGATVAADARWPEALLLCTGDSRCGVAPRGAPAAGDPTSP
jgi:hypothetical protein